MLKSGLLNMVVSNKNLLIAGLATIAGIGLATATTVKAVKKHEEIKKERLETESVIEEVAQNAEENGYTEEDYINDLFITQNKYIAKHVIAFFQPVMYAIISILSAITFVKKYKLIEPTV